MNLKRVSRISLAAFLAIANGLIPVSSYGTTSGQPAGAQESDVAAKLAAIEKEVDDKRKELGVPGLSLAIVKDDRVIYAKGLGLKDVQRNLPVTDKTLFAIGSCSKAFTGLAAMMSVDDGKLSLDDPPGKYIPYFKIQDPDIDAKITVRDLLCHRSGLEGTDLAWYTGVLNREEVIKAAAAAKPTAKLGEKFQYQNVMYSAAGEVIAHAQRSTWEKVIAQRIFKPLGMNSSNTSAAQTQESKDFATGYDIARKTPRKLGMRDLTNIAAGGAINSNAVDMAKWVRLMLGAGVFEGKRLVSEKSWNEYVTKHITVGGNTGYALGWGVTQWRGQRVLTHSGGIDGFNSLVSLLPDQKIGIVLLTNVSTSPIAVPVRDAVFLRFSGISEPTTAAKTASGAGSPGSDIIGKYERNNVAIEVAAREDKPVLIVPGQPVYTLVERLRTRSARQSCRMTTG